jgi:uncharacterized membrane protein
MTFAAWLCVIQGLYYLLTGVWPLVSMRTFEAVTGEKIDDWLVKTVGALIIVIGGVMLLAGLRSQVPLEVAVLAAGSALALMGIDVWYTARGIIPRVYLLDAMAELIILACWTGAWLLGR